MLNLAVKWFISQAQVTWDRAVTNPKSTFTGFAYSGGIVSFITYLETQLHCDLTQVKFLALLNSLQGMRGVDSGRTTGDDEHDKASQA